MTGKGADGIVFAALAMYDRAIEKVGGAFKLTVLIQKRVREIIRGASPLVPVTPEMSPIDIALQEILEDKISLAEELELKEAAAREASAERKTKDGEKEKKAAPAKSKAKKT